MASSAVSSQTALRRPAAFASAESAEVFLRYSSAIPKLKGVTPASRLEVRPAPEMASSGVAAVDAFAGGLPRGCLSEICGPASSGRTSVLVAALAAATQREEACALVDTTDGFDPLSAAGVQFERLLWIRCGLCDAERRGNFAKRSSREVEASLQLPSAGAGIPRSARDDKAQRALEHSLRVTDLLLQSGGFGLVAIDLSDVPFQMARRIPLTTWFRFQRAVENTATVLLVIGQAPNAQTCAALLIKLSAISPQLSEQTSPPHAQFFEGMRIESELLRSRVERKPAASVRTVFASKTKWGELLANG